MTTLYSLNGTRPTPLPFRITLPNGFTRTDPSTFTEDEITAAGFTGPYDEPAYDPATQQLDWIDGAYVISPLPPPPAQPDWKRFKGSLLTSAEGNAALAAAMPYAAGAVLSLPAALMQASANNYQDFRASWLMLRRAGLIPRPLLDSITALAVSCNLPAEFTDFLGGEMPAGDPSPKPQGWNPQPDPSRGESYQAPDGSWWKWDQPRNESGQYVADDPDTAEVESALRWLAVSPD